MNGSGVQMTPKNSVGMTRGQFLRKLLAGVAVATVAPSVVAEMCERLEIPKGTVYSFGREGRWVINPAWESAKYQVEFLMRHQDFERAQPMAWEANQPTGLYRGIEFGLDPNPLRFEFEGGVFRPVSRLDWHVAGIPERGKSAVKREMMELA